MATHSLVFTESEEAMYKQYLALTKSNEETHIANIKNAILAQCIQTMNDHGVAKFKKLSDTDKIAFLKD